MQAQPGRGPPARDGDPPGSRSPGSQGFLFQPWLGALSWPGVATVPKEPWEALVCVKHAHQDCEWEGPGGTCPHSEEVDAWTQMRAITVSAALRGLVRWPDVAHASLSAACPGLRWGGPGDRPRPERVLRCRVG